MLSGVSPVKAFEVVVVTEQDKFASHGERLQDTIAHGLSFAELQQDYEKAIKSARKKSAKDKLQRWVLIRQTILCEII